MVNCSWKGCKQEGEHSIWLHIRVAGNPAIAVVAPICPAHLGLIRVGMTNGDVRAGIRLPAPNKAKDVPPSRKLRKVAGDATLPSTPVPPRTG